MTLRETRGKIIIGLKKNDDFQIESGIKQREALSAVLFNLALYYAIEKVDLKRNEHSF